MSRDPLEYGSTSIGGPIRRTTNALNTQFQNPDGDEATTIEVTDPAHPLYGRRFQIISITHPLNSPGHVYARYRKKMVLHIPITATDLALTRSIVRTKLTSQAVEEFILLANQCEVLCQPSPKISGEKCLRISNKKSSPKSRRSFRR